MKTKSDTIAEIMRLNPTVGAAFLSEFNNDDLISYLRRLRDLGDAKLRERTLNFTTLPPKLSEALQSA